MARFVESRLSPSSRQSTPTSLQIAGNMGSALDGSRTLAGMLLAAAMAALLVVADQLIETWTDGHLLAGWVALWTVVFAGMALLAPPLRQMAAFSAGGFMRYVAEVRAQRQEARKLKAAGQAPRASEETSDAK